MFCKEENGLFIVNSNHLMDYGPLCDELIEEPSLELLVKQQLTESGPRLMSAKGVGGESFWGGLGPEMLRGSESPGFIGETPDRPPGQQSEIFHLGYKY